MDGFAKIVKKEKVIISLILLLAFFFRFFRLDSDPVSLSMDEVSIGYNAYSIQKTARDEWGNFLPLAFRSVGDYKPPVNIYLTVPAIFIFGLSEFGVRFPVAFAGLLSVLVFILLLKELGFRKIGYLLGGLWLAISPWHVHFSRGSFEAILALFFILLGTLVFLMGLRKKSYLFFSLSIVSFILSVWTYHAERAFTPILLVFLLVNYRDKLKFLFKNPKKLSLSLLPFVILAVPFIWLTFFTPVIRERAISTSILREQSLIQVLQFGEYKSLGDSLFNNDFYLTFRHFMGKYLNYFDLRFWFWKGMQYTPPEYPDIGLFYTVELIPMLLGIYLSFMSKNKLLRTLSVFWFFAGPVPASFTMNEQHPLRALVWLPFFGLAFALGTQFLIEAKFSFKKILICIYIFLMFLNITFFADMYFRQFPRFSSEYWGYGFKEIALYACQNQGFYETVYVTDTYGSMVPNNTGIPAEYILFYCKIDPFQHLTKNISFEKIKIRRFQWKSEVTIPKNSLIIGSYWDSLPEHVKVGKVVKTINYPSGKPAFIFVDTRGL